MKGAVALAVLLLFAGCVGEPQSARDGNDDEVVESSRDPYDARGCVWSACGPGRGTLAPSPGFDLPATLLGVTAVEPANLQASENWVVWISSINGSMANVITAIDRETGTALQYYTETANVFGMTLLDDKVHFSEGTIPADWQLGPPQGMTFESLLVPATWKIWDLEARELTEPEEAGVSKYQMLNGGDATGLSVRFSDDPLNPWVARANENLAFYSPASGFQRLVSGQADTLSLDGALNFKVVGDNVTMLQTDGARTNVLELDSRTGESTVRHNLTWQPIQYWPLQDRTIAAADGRLAILKGSDKSLLTTRPAEGFGFAAADPARNLLAWSEVVHGSIGISAAGHSSIMLMNATGAVARDIATSAFHQFADWNGNELVVVETDWHAGEPYNAIWAVDFSGVLNLGEGT